MPWKEVSVVNLRNEFIKLVKNNGNITRVCKNFGISRKTGYKWLERFGTSGEKGLEDLSRRPIRSPERTNTAMEEAILEVRERHPKWGGRKIRRVLQGRGLTDVPAPSTITEILKRNGLIDELETSKYSWSKRFERQYPNDLWQMDFKGHVACPEGRCHPLTVLDDHSRYSVVLKACLDERTQTVQSHLIEAFRKYGLPNQIINDNGPPWGNQGRNPFTQLTVWLMRLGVLVSNSAPAHPETLGKDERFHRTLKAELLGDSIPWRIDQTQTKFDQWRFEYNHLRPHEALNMETPSARFNISNRPFPESLPPIEYGTGDIVRKVQFGGIVHFKGREIQVPRALVGCAVALRSRPQCDGIFELYFIRQLVIVINLNNHD